MSISYYGHFFKSNISQAKGINNEVNKSIQLVAEAYFNNTVLSIKNKDYDYTNLNKIIDNKKIINFEKERSKYTKRYKEKCGAPIYNYDLKVNLENSEQTENSVINRYNVECAYKNPDDSIRFVDQGVYTLTFVQNKDLGWVISDIKYPESITEAFPMGIETNNWGELHKQLDEFVEPTIKNQTIESLKTQLEPEVNALSNAYYYNYNRSAAVQYALNHTENWWECTHTTGTARQYCTKTYSTYFTNYMSGFVDCANFSSQCIWYGFGGLENQTSISNHRYPMFFNWYGDSSDTHYNWRNNCPDSVNGWISVFSNNYTSDIYGVQAIVYTNASNLAIGDVVWGGNHSMVVTNITADGKIYVSGHTNNNRNIILADAYPYALPTKYVKILRTKVAEPPIY